MNLLFWYRSLMRSVGAALVKLIATATSGLVSFTTNVIRPVKVTCEFSPVQEGTGDPSPDNVRPISGWTGCNIFNRGDSFYNNTGLTYAAINTTVTALAPDSINVKATSANYPASKQLLSNYNLVNGKTYVIAADVDVTSGIGKIALRRSNNRVELHSEDITESGYYYYIFTYVSSTMNYLSFFCNFSSSSSGDVTYRNIVFAEVNEQLPISWQSEAGTVYGGTVTLNEDGSADLVQTHRYFVVNPSSARINADKDTMVWAQIDLPSNYNASPNTRNLYSNIFTNRSYSVIYGASASVTGNKILFGLPAEYDTTTLIQQFFTDNQTQFAYLLATPTTYHFDNIGQLQSFLGANNIWHDMNGSITAEYYKKQ